MLCEICEKTFTRKSSLKTHMELHSGKKEKIQCSQCSRQFSKISNLKEHCKKYHKDINSDKIIGNSQTKVEIPKVVNAHKCSLCNKSYEKQSSLRGHLKEVHLKSERVKCKFCEKTFRNKYGARKHLKIYHKDKELSGCRLSSKEPIIPNGPTTVQNCLVEDEATITTGNPLINVFPLADFDEIIPISTIRIPTWPRKSNVSKEKSNAGVKNMLNEPLAQPSETFTEQNVESKKTRVKRSSTPLENEVNLSRKKLRSAKNSKTTLDDFDKFDESSDIAVVKDMHEEPLAQPPKIFTEQNVESKKTVERSSKAPKNQVNESRKKLQSAKNSATNPDDFDKFDMDVVHNSSFREIQTNVYSKSTQLHPPPEMSPCKCNPENSCVEKCINRLSFMECNPETCPCGNECKNTNIQKHCNLPVERFLTEEKGWGIKTNDFIREGTFIFEYTGEIVSRDEYEKRLCKQYASDTDFYCLDLGKGMVIDSHRQGNNARFVNHSCEPNCIMQKWLVGGKQHACLFSKKDIRVGEELTFDYGFQPYGNPQSCKCASKNCRQFIVSKSIQVEKPALKTTDPKKAKKQNKKFENDLEEFAGFSTIEIEDAEQRKSSFVDMSRRKARVIKSANLANQLDVNDKSLTVLSL